MTDLTEDIVELQTRLQFQDDVIQKLDDEVIRQGVALDTLLRRVVDLEERLEQLISEREGVSAPEPKPPHY